MNILKRLVHYYQKKIIENFSQELTNFVQVCPKEMLEKLKYPITNKISKVS